VYHSEDELSEGAEYGLIVLGEKALKRTELWPLTAERQNTGMMLLSRIAYLLSLCLLSLALLTSCLPVTPASTPLEATPSRTTGSAATPSSSTGSAATPSYTVTPHLESTESSPPSSVPAPTPQSTRVSAPLDQARALRPEFIADLDLVPDATRYEIELTVDLDEAVVVGRERVEYCNTEDVPLDVLYVRLFPNTPGYGGTMTATNVSLDGQPVTPVVELGGSALRLPLAPSLAPGARLKLELDFTLVVPADTVPTAGADQGYRQLGFYDGVLTLPNAYPLIPVYDDEGWNIELAPPYGDAVYSETALYTVHLTALREMMGERSSPTVVASGTCASSGADPADGVTWTCVTGPVRDFNAVLGLDYRVTSEVVEGITVNSFFYPGHQVGGERALDWAAEVVRLFSARFGPYPFVELDVVETPTRAGGIEYPGLVVINSGYYEEPGGRMEWVVVHEVVHQWWYSLVGNDQVDEPWLDEALTQYSTLLYYENRYGMETAAELLREVFQGPYENLVDSGRDAPVGLPVAAYSAADYGPVVYRKGPLYFHALRGEVGDRDFWAILETYFARNRYGVATPEGWLTAVEMVTGDEHRALYERWIMGKAEP